VNLLTREIALKIVYYGPGLGGKTTTLQFIHRALKPDSRGQLVSLATGVDRTLYFDFLPVKLPKLRGFAVRVQLYTVPGQVHYNSTRKLVLTGADGIVFVADSQRDRAAANVESLENLNENLREQGLSLRGLPLVIQYNKRDVHDPLPVAELDARLNTFRTSAFETVAPRGTGVFDALKAITSQVLSELRRKGALQGADGGRAATASGLGGVGGVGPGGAGASLGAGAGLGAGGGIPVPFRDTPSAGIVAAQSVPVSVPDEPFTLHSLGEVAEAIEKLNPSSDGRTSGAHRIPTATNRALSELVPPGAARDALLLVEQDIERGDFNSAVRRAGNAFEDLSSRLAGSLAGSGPAEAPPLAALLTGIAAGRYLRFREATFRVASGGAVSSSDALFALFFLTDFAMRAEELRKM
jgi:signal recognition particle receptor subunit beta